jgi:argininosuccinate lyase
MLLRDAQRLRDCRERVNVMPLGAAALAGTGYPIDREYTAEQLGFTAVAENSLDAVSDRDFAIEFCAAGALLMTHMSRIAEELVLWTSAQFQFVELPDRFCTGSSIMPQKKNPDVAELVRGKSGRVNGNLIALLTVMKGQPLAYNKDNQEDKEPLFDTVDTMFDSLRAFTDMLGALRPVSDNMRSAAGAGFATATDLADYLVGKGLAFRDAHHAVGEIVAAALNQGCDIGDLPLATLQNHSAAIDDDVYQVLTLEGSVRSREHFGGTAPAQVQAAVLRARERVAALDT